MKEATKISGKRLIGAVLLVTLLFTYIDALVHATVEALEIYSYPIPEFGRSISESPLFWYAVGKFVSTLIISLLIIPFIRRWRFPAATKTLGYTLVIIALLEVRYFLSGAYDTTWHIYNVLMHFAVLFVSSFFVYKKLKIFS